MGQSRPRKGQFLIVRKVSGVVLLAHPPILNVACTPWRFFSQVRDHSQYGVQKRDYQHLVAPVFAITQPSPLHVE